MQDEFKHHNGDAHDKESKNPRDNPIEQTSTPTDPAVDPAAVVKPPHYGNPEEGDGGENDQ